MDAVVKLAMSLHLLKQAETHIQKGHKAEVKKWDKIKGISDAGANKDVTNPDDPNPKDIPKDVYNNNKQLISGTGPGPVMS